MLNKIKATLTERGKRILLVTSCYVLSCLLLGILTFVLIAHEAEFSEIFYNSLFTIGLFSLALVISRRFIVSFPVVCVVLVFFYYLDTYVYHSRLTHVQYHDVYCIGDALSVSSNYPLVIDLDIVLDIVLTVSVCMLYVVLVRSKVETPEYIHKNNMVAGATGLAFVVLFFVFGRIPIEDVGFDLNGYTEKNGLFYAWYSQYKQSFIKMPQDYSADRADVLLSEYSCTHAENVPENVIVIMNEALADYSLIGETNFSKDPLKNLHSYKDNFISGKLAVNVYAGNTCNSEFEFLTGMSLAFLPVNSIPYMQYMNDNIPSVTNDMSLLGYACRAIHPYFAQEWRRSNVYSMLDFDVFISGEDFSQEYTGSDYGNITNVFLKSVDFGADLEYIRGFVSDRECYKKVIDILDAKLDEERTFVFAVTIQNHGGYNYNGEDFISDLYVDEQYEAENQYLTCSSYSDEAFKELTDYLETLPERTAVLMFGDHQPGLSDIKNSLSLYSDKDNYAESSSDIYMVPYYIWANYDIVDNDYDSISVNYLSAVFKECVGLPLTQWDNLRIAAAQEYPILTKNFAVNNTGKYMVLDQVNSEIINNYELVQYRLMFDN